MNTNKFQIAILLCTFLLAPLLHANTKLSKLSPSNPNDTLIIDSVIRSLEPHYRKPTPEVLKTYKECLKASEKLDYDFGKVWASFRLGSAYQYSNMNDSALSTFKACSEFAKTANDTNMLMRSYGKLAYLFSKVAEYDSAIKYSKQSIYLSYSIKDSAKIVTGNNNLAIQFRYAGNWDSSLATLQTNELILRECSDTIRLANCIQLQAKIYHEQGNIKAALDHFYKALDVIKPLPKHPVELITKNYLAELYLEMEEPEKTLEILNNTQVDVINHLRNQYQHYSLKGRTFEMLNNPDSALFYYNLCIKRADKNKQENKKIQAYLNIGSLLNKQGKYNEAIEALNKSKKLSIRYNLKQELASTLNTMGISYYGTENLNLAKTNFSQAYQIGQELGDLTIQRDAAKGLFQVYKNENDYRKAFENLSIYNSLNEQLVNAENIKELTSKQLQYNFDLEKESLKQEQLKEQIAHTEELKRHRITIFAIIIFSVLLIVISFVLYRAYSIKTKADHEKEALLKEIHHRVKNNLQIISSLLNIQTEYTKDASIIGAVHESQSRVKAMALIHQLLYQEENFTRINFEEYLTQLTKTLSAIFQQKGSHIETEIISDKVALDIDTSIPLGLIVTELVSNAYKYAFNDSKQGHIKIELSKKAPKQYELAIHDNGCGLPDNFDIEGTSSMGLKLVNLLTEQIDGNLSYMNHKGSHFKLTFAEN